MRYAFIIILFCALITISCKENAKKITSDGVTSGISSIHLTDSKVQDLFLLGKVWGFLKYYHPAIAQGNYNWDNELFGVLTRILDCKSKKESNAILVSLINSLPKVQPITTEDINSNNIKLYPDLKWMEDTIMIGEELSRILEEIKSSKRTNHNYYVSITPKGNPQFDNENPYEKDIYPDAGFRLLSLYRYWNIIQYYYPYRNLIMENWDSVLLKSIPTFISASNNLQYKLAVLSLIAHVHDTHANFYNKDSTLRRYYGINCAPIRATFIENKAVINFINKNFSEKYGLKRGDILLKINNKNVSDIVNQELPFTPASNYPTQLREIALNLLRTNDTLVLLSFMAGDSVKEVNMRCYPLLDSNIQELFNHKDTCLKYLSPQIAYLNPRFIKNEYLPIIMPNILKMKGIVIDLRCYPKEPIVYSLTHYLLPDSTNFVRFTEGNIMMPGLFTFISNLKVGEKNEQYFKGKIVVLINEETQSQAEFTAMALRVAPKAKIIGSTTAGADGDVSFIYLPGGIKTAISGIGIYYPDGRETQRVGIVPDIEVNPTLAGIKENKDEVLEKAIEIINGK